MYLYKKIINKFLKKFKKASQKWDAFLLEKFNSNHKLPNHLTKTKSEIR